MEGTAVLGGLIVRPLRADEWRISRALRLRALADSPDAFGTAFADAEARGDEWWIEAAARSAAQPLADMLVVEAAGDPAGLAYLRIEDPREAGLWSLWVAPAARRRGAGRALVEAATAWAAERGAVRLAVWVAAGNHPARAFFAAAGFTPTGASRPFRADSAIEEFGRQV